MATDYDALQRAILRNRQATGQMAGLDEEYGRANALRDQAQPEVNQYGTVSPLAVLANTIDKSRGRQESRGLEKTRTQGREDIAAGEAAMESYTLKNTMDKRAEEALKSQQATEKIDTDAEQLVVANQQQTDEQNLNERKQRWAETKAAGESMTFTNGTNKIPVTTDSKGNLIAAGDNEAAGVKKGDFLPDGYIEDESSKAGYEGGQFLRDSTIKELTESSSMITKFDDLVGRFEGQSQIKNIPTKIGNQAVAFMSRNDLLGAARDNNLSQEARDAAQWWADFAMIYELPRRHEIFGATLTNNELKSWDRAVGAMEGMNPQQMKERLAKLQQDLRNDYATKINTHLLAKSGSDRASKALRYMGTAAGGQFLEGTEDNLMSWAIKEVDDKNIDSGGEDPQQVASLIAKYATQYNEITDKAGFAKKPYEEQQLLLQIMAGENPNADPDSLLPKAVRSYRGSDRTL